MKRARIARRPPPPPPSVARADLRAAPPTPSLPSPTSTRPPAPGFRDGAAYLGTSDVRHDEDTFIATARRMALPLPGEAAEMGEDALTKCMQVLYRDTRVLDDPDRTRRRPAPTKLETYYHQGRRPRRRLVVSVRRVPR